MRKVDGWRSLAAKSSDQTIDLTASDNLVMLEIPPKSIPTQIATAPVLERKITDKLTLGVELFHQTPDKSGGMQSTGFNVGGIYEFTDHYHFLLSLGLLPEL
jgi:hypothetical protein